MRSASAVPSLFVQVRVIHTCLYPWSISVFISFFSDYTLASEELCLL